jgi:hypothetical protein
VTAPGTEPTKPLVPPLAAQDNPTVTTVLSQKGQVVLTVPLRRIRGPANRGLVDLLLACPAPFEVPDRDPDDSRAAEL